MRTTERSFLAMDAGQQREYLAEQLADWRDAQFWPLASAERFYRRAKVLARRIGGTLEEVMENLSADADAIEAARVEARATEGMQ